MRLSIRQLALTTSILTVFEPSALFAASEPGIWYDPSDLTTLFQDNAGTTPVTTPGQAVARIDDKSGRGNNATQGTPASRPIYSIVPAGGLRNLLTYTEQFENAAWLKQNAGTGLAPVVTVNAATAPDGTTTADLVAFNRGAGNLVSDRSVLSQAPSGITSNTYVGSIWLKAATSGDIGKQIGIRTVGGTNYGVVTLTADWERVTRVETGSAANFELASRGTITVDNQVSVHVWGAQLETGSTVTAYQKVVSQYEVTEAGVSSLYYLFFDGVDDFLVTPTITPGTDKAQVFAGVRKLSDAGSFPIIVESSATINTNNGAILLSSRAAGVAGFNFGSKGTTIANSTGVSSAAPVTRVLSGLGDISAPSSRMRVNGVAGTAVVTSQGTGNYLAYPMYIGRRGGTGTALNFHLYSLIVRFGENLLTDQIISTELWINEKTGAY